MEKRVREGVGEHGTLAYVSRSRWRDTGLLSVCGARVNFIELSAKFCTRETRGAGRGRGEFKRPSGECVMRMRKLYPAARWLCVLVALNLLDAALVVSSRRKLSYYVVLQGGVRARMTSFRVTLPASRRRSTRNNSATIRIS